MSAPCRWVPNERGLTAHVSFDCEGCEVCDAYRGNPEPYERHCRGYLEALKRRDPESALRHRRNMAEIEIRAMGLDE